MAITVLIITCEKMLKELAGNDMAGAETWPLVRVGVLTWNDLGRLSRQEWNAKVGRQNTNRNNHVSSSLRPVVGPTRRTES